MKRLILNLATAFFLLGYCSGVNAQTAPLAELRGVWIVTLANIDWPSAPGLSARRQQMEFDSILDVLKALGTNAVFVQVRPAGDALYPGNLAPWSKYLTGRQGVAPEPYYDPLQYMINAAHQRRIELHAWLNPFRASSDLDTAALAPSHPLRSLPRERLSEWFFQYGGKYYFNPASPLVRRYIQNVVRDIVLRYDVDGVHFDDYFYPLPVKDQSLNDYDFYKSDPRGFANIEDWRRDNVNRFIQETSAEIRSLKPFVKFGVSPAGVWRNNDKDPIYGSATRGGLTSYDDLYADALLWLQKGWIDYVTPQVYWSIGFPPTEYQTLTAWWSSHAYGQHVYIGHAGYKVGNDPNDPSWNQPDQISRQIALNRLNSRIQGSVIYSAGQLVKNKLGLRDTLIRNVYRKQAMLPAFTARSPRPPSMPEFCGAKGGKRSVKLAWNACSLTTGDEAPYYFAIFRFDGDKVGDLKDPNNLLALTAFNPIVWTFDDQSAVQGARYTYVVQAFNRYNVESVPSEPLMIRKTAKSMKVKRKLFGWYF